MGHTEGIEPTISTHLLDTERGTPAAGVRVTLFRVDGKADRQVGEGTSDADGRIARLLEGRLEAGDYRLVFDLVDTDRADGPDGSGGGAFFRRLTVELRVGDASRSYHVPLLLAPYALTTYRGN